MIDDDIRTRPPKNGDNRTLKDGTHQVFRNGTWNKVKQK